MNSITFSKCQKIIPALLIGLAGILLPVNAHSAPKRYDYAEDTNTTLREIRASVDDLKHEVSNHETEIRMYEEKLDTQQNALDSLRQQIVDAGQGNKELIKSNLSNLESKTSSLESTSKGLVADLKQLKDHANDSSTALEKYEGRIARIEKMIEVQNKNMSNLELALASIMDALQVKETAVEKKNKSSSSSNSGALSSSTSETKTYKVKSGDSIGKIAKDNGTTSKAIRELNQLTNDKIIIGQILELP